MNHFCDKDELFIPVIVIPCVRGLTTVSLNWSRGTAKNVHKETRLMDIIAKQYLVKTFDLGRK